MSHSFDFDSFEVQWVPGNEIWKPADPLILIKEPWIAPPNRNILMVPFDTEKKAGFTFHLASDTGLMGGWHRSIHPFHFRRADGDCSAPRIPVDLISPRGVKDKAPRIYVRGEVVFHVAPFLTLYITTQTITLGFHKGKARIPNKEAEFPMTSQNLWAILMGTAKLGQRWCRTERGVRSAHFSLTTGW